MTDCELLQHLKEQVEELQSRGTAQLIASRQAAYEMAAQECERLAEGCWDEAGAAALSCAQAIRALAKR
jgi:hypothetical protein